MRVEPGSIVAIPPPGGASRWRFLIVGCPHTAHMTLAGAEACARLVRENRVPRADAERHLRRVFGGARL